jgi:hypothetical protein
LGQSFTDLFETARQFDHNLNYKLDLIIERLHHMSNELDSLTSQVAANNTVLGSALVLINSIAQRITDAGVDPAKLATLTSSLKSQDDALAAAVLANTPVVVEGTAWIASDIYAVGDTVVGSDSQTYTSTQVENQGNDPTAANSQFWSLVPVTTVPSSVVKQ